MSAGARDQCVRQQSQNAKEQQAGQRQATVSRSRAGGGQGLRGGLFCWSGSIGAQGFQSSQFSLGLLRAAAL